MARTIVPGEGEHAKLPWKVTFDIPEGTVGLEAADGSGIACDLLSMPDGELIVKSVNAFPALVVALRKAQAHYEHSAIQHDIDSRGVKAVEARAEAAHIGRLLKEVGE